MASKVEKRKGSRLRKKEEVDDLQPVVKPTNEEYAIAKWMKANVHKKRTKFLNHAVEYFTASKAIDNLLTSQWSKPGKKGEEPLFTTRESVVEYLNILLLHKFFHRAKKIAVTAEELKARSKKRNKKKEEEIEKKEEADNDKKQDEADSSHTEEKAKEKTKKERRKIRLDMHLEQHFVDGNEAYVWIYDPIPYYYWLAGGGVVLAVVAFCLFPLWPPIVRKGVYYLSVGAAGFLIFILGLAVLRIVVFCLLWLLSMGRHHLWLFPNLTEDVGFFASFWPLWKYEYKDKNGSSMKKDKKLKAKKVSDDENDGADDVLKEEDEEDDDDATAGDATQAEKSETESEGSHKIAKDYEIIDREEANVSDREHDGDEHKEN
uniref:Translocation protein SEC62 n=1 Tax=Evadne anonyx TaxID=141404 RepID=A0A9N6WQH1_9CRUS|nr:EOG090X0D00 [Evadne anonyx]